MATKKKIGAWAYKAAVAKAKQLSASAGHAIKQVLSGLHSEKANVVLLGRAVADLHEQYEALDLLQEIGAEVQKERLS